jgi:hypothetical protein|tara:strand:- start:433 stop:540 length:108 start_codon:yes stop_codon:yes gene_type:complete
MTSAIHIKTMDLSALAAIAAVIDGSSLIPPPVLAG